MTRLTEPGFSHTVHLDKVRFTLDASLHVVRPSNTSEGVTEPLVTSTHTLDTDSAFCLICCIGLLCDRTRDGFSTSSGGDPLREGGTNSERSTEETFIALFFRGPWVHNQTHKLDPPLDPLPGLTPDALPGSAPDLCVFAPAGMHHVRERSQQHLHSTLHAGLPHRARGYGRQRGLRRRDAAVFGYAV